MKRNGNTKRARSFSLFSLNKQTVIYWIVFAVFCGGLLALELCGWHRLWGLTDTAFWQTVIAPFCRELEQNYINLYISQISTTFLVTSFLSFLGGRDNPIYWTSAMEYKLINPKGSSLRDVTWYCLGTLVTSVTAIVLRASLMFLFSFGINLLGLTIITCRMIFAFFARDDIKRQLQREFLNADAAGKSEKLQLMEANIVQAAHNHDVGYLNECLEFFRYLERQDEMKFNVANYERLRWFLQVIPDQLNDVRWGVFARLAHMMGLGGVVEEDRFRRGVRSEPRRQKPRSEEEDGVMPVGKESLPRMNMQLYDRCKQLREDVLRILQANIRSGALTERDMNRWCEAAVALSRRNITERAARAGSVTSLDFKTDFSGAVLLLKEAYDHRRSLDDALFMLRELHRTVENGQTTKDRKVHCYGWNELAVMFRCLCDDRAMTEQSRLTHLMTALQTAHALSENRAAVLLGIVDASVQFSDEEKASLCAQIKRLRNAATPTGGETGETV